MGQPLVVNGFVVDGITIFNFFIEMLLAGVVVTASLKREERYWARLAVTLPLSAGIWYVLTFVMPSTHFLYDYLRYFLLFLTCLAGLYFCYDLTLSGTLFCGTAAYAMQHLICRIYILLFYLPGALFGYWSETWVDVPHFIAYWSILAALYFAFHRFLGRQLKISQAKFSTKGQVATVALLLLVTLFISATYDLTGEDIINHIIFLFCDGLCVALLLIIQLHAYGLSQKEREMAEAESLHRMELRQMRQTREMIELINIKSHDLKHQLIAAGGKLSEAEAEEITRAVCAYDSAVNTGLEALDLVVSQKKMACDREGILLTCMLEGELLSFMSDVHIYSLVGNVLDNAIEAARVLPEEQRYIVFEVQRAAGAILLRTENEYEGELRWREGTLLTSKGDEDYHGFGMKSVSAIVEKYGGIMSISAQNGLFVLSITFTGRSPA